MGATGKFIHSSSHAINIACTTSYNTARRHQINLQDSTGPLGTAVNKNRARLSGLYITLDTLSAAPAPTSITWHYRDWETDRKSTRLNSSH